jgi:proton-coupled amino acid transporter
MPIAFKHSGLTVGVFATVLVAIICTHCSYILVKCAHKLYERTHVTALSFADVGTVAFTNGPAWGKPFAGFARYLYPYFYHLTLLGLQCNPAHFYKH